MFSILHVCMHFLITYQARITKRNWSYRCESPYIKMLKMLLFHAINENVAVLTEDGHLPSFFVPNPGDLTAQESPLPGICHPRQKNANARGSPQEGGGGELGAGGGID